MSFRRKRIGPKPPPLPSVISILNNKAPKDWDLGYELVVSFRYGLDEEVIAKIAGLRNCDTGMDLRSGVRDLMFPCGTDLKVARSAARRLWRADYFGSLRLRISYPVEHVGKDSFTCWHDKDGKLLERVKHRHLSKVIKIFKAKAPKRRRRAA